MSELDQYEYELPADLIAQHPLRNRVDARLLVVERATGTISHHHIRDLPSLLQPSDCLVLNDTRVIPARLVGHRTATGGRWQGLFLSANEAGHWQIMGKTRGKIEPGETITLEDRWGRDAVQLKLLAKQDGGNWVAAPQSRGSYLELLDEVGRVPLPPYIRDGEMEEGDSTTYQTVFAQHPGAVAAPTAGLHFTESLLQRLQAVGIESERVTLHVGVGTFRPVSVSRLDDHPMHSEWAEVTEPAARRLQAVRDAGRRLIAVGTTSVRTLESALVDGVIQPMQRETNLFIRPPYQFQAVDVLLTNFHLPKSTLLVLVQCFGGQELIRRAYAEAIQERYRFYSYGDAMLII